MADPIYVPIALGPGWVLERYHGWSVLEEDRDLKVLLRGWGPATRSLVLVRGAAPERVEAAVLRTGKVARSRLIVLVDFLDGSLAPERRLGDRVLARVGGARWFGAGTFVIDLTEPPERLWRNLAARERSKCNQARASGVTVTVTAEPSALGVTELLELHGAMARRRGLEPVRRDVVARMFRAGDALLTTCRSPEGVALVTNLTYLCGEQACFLVGARRDDAPPGAGPLAHWETLVRLQQAGKRWYDLGFVASTDAEDGIHRFKRSLGGSFVASGSEYRWIAPLLDRPHRWLRRLRRGLTSLGPT